LTFFAGFASLTRGSIQTGLPTTGLTVLLSNLSLEVAETSKQGSSLGAVSLPLLRDGNRGERRELGVEVVDSVSPRDATKIIY
jgi:hypothetical protein